MMNYEDQKTVLRKLMEVVGRLQNAAVLSPIVRTPEGTFRHAKQNVEVYLFMKAVRYISLLNSARVLTENGFFQEIGIICRCLAETENDFFFIAMPKTDANNERRTQHLAEFYLEEFKPKTAGLIDSHKRNRVARRNFHFNLAASHTTVNSSDATQAYSILETTFSGYVHGVYGHLMELYGGPFHRFQVDGLPRQGGSRELSMSYCVF
jgi:hypothetical protein